MAAIEPGVTTRDDVRMRRGTPWYPATLLVVYVPAGTVRGIEYFGAGKDRSCPDRCRKGELLGLQAEQLQILVAPVSFAQTAGLQPEPALTLPGDARKVIVPEAPVD